MKKIIFNTLALIACTMAFSSCTEDMEWKDSKVVAPTDLFAPADNQSVTLLSSATASVVFEWGNAQAEDGGAPNYEVVFDKVGGDYSEPLYKIAADLGTLSKATISHKALNTIAGMAGAGSGETAAVQWTVIAYRGLSKAQATKSNTVNLTRFFGFDEIPGSLYLIGDAVENGSIACGSPANGEFEVFVKLEGGKTFSMNTSANGSGKAFSIDGDRIKEGNDGYTVAKTGVYRVSMDFNVASVTGMKEIKSLGLYHCDPNVILVDLTYDGKGVWKANNVQLPASGDERYRFHMTYADDSMIIWGAIASQDGRPNGAVEGDVYYKLYEYATDNGDRWGYKWKWEGDYYGKQVNVSVTFNVPVYTHYISPAN